MNYIQQAEQFVKRWGRITAGDIQDITHTTAPHKVLQALRIKGIIDDGEWRTSGYGKRYKVHYRKTI